MKPGSPAIIPLYPYFYTQEGPPAIILVCDLTFRRCICVHLFSRSTVSRLAAYPSDRYRQATQSSDRGDAAAVSQPLDDLLDGLGGSGSRSEPEALPGCSDDRAPSPPSRSRRETSCEMSQVPTKAPPSPSGIDEDRPGDLRNQRRRWHQGAGSEPGSGSRSRPGGAVSDGSGEHLRSSSECGGGYLDTGSARLGLRRASGCVHLSKPPSVASRAQQEGTDPILLPYKTGSGHPLRSSRGSRYLPPRGGVVAPSSSPFEVRKLQGSML